MGLKWWRFLPTALLSATTTTTLSSKRKKGKFAALARKVKELHQKGQPVLVGTVSIEKNELLSAYLKREGVPHEILNAKNHEREGEIVAAAGKKGKGNRCHQHGGPRRRHQAWRRACHK